MHAVSESRMYRSAPSRRKSVGSASMLGSSLGAPPSSLPSFSRDPSSTGSESSSSSTIRGSLARNGQGQGASLTMPNLIDLKTITAEEIEWEGYLYKQRKIVKNWTPRYITLQNRTVTVYKSKTHAIAKEPNRGKWVVHQILNTLPSTGFGGSKLQPDVMGFSFLATNGNLVHFTASSGLQKAAWLHALRQSLQRANAETASLLPTPAAPVRASLSRGNSSTDGSAEDGPALARSLSFSVATATAKDTTFETTVTKALADKFLADVLETLRERATEAVADKLPTLLHQLAKDVELWFDLETAESAQPSCVFKGVYHGREGFVQFLSLYMSKYVLAPEPDGDVVHRAEDDDHHGYACMHHLINTVSGSKTLGKFALQLSFSPAKRVSRAVLSFRQRASSSSSSKVVRKSVQANPIAMSEHAACFYQAFLTKRSLAMSFSDFDVVGVLGQGGFGTVVLVKRHLSSDEYFAIKIIDKHSGAESALKERRILSGVRHPFLACLRFAFQTQTKLYLGLDYYKGGNLYLHMHTAKMDPTVSISSGRRFDVERARFYAAELAIAISYLHSHGIIYRDLKPDNIMLDRFGHIRLVDFGISKQLRSDESGNGLYEPTGTLAGSPAYIAPEQLLTQKPQYGMAADWWSYGVLLYEMLTGATPFHDNNVSLMYKKIQTAEINYDKVRPALDDDAVDLLKKLLVRDPAERIGSQELMSHPFFATIDWARLEIKDVDVPFIPPTDELMANVHDHFRNMKVEESIGEMDVKTGKKGTTLNLKDESHFDEFSFAYDTTRATFDGLSMADDGWLMRQLAEGAALRGRLASGSAGDDEEPGVPDDQTSEEDGIKAMNTTATNSGSPGSGSDGEVNGTKQHL
jgi:serum/glucocorticoid-regulated kinase 2